MSKENWESYFDAVKRHDWKSAKDIIIEISKAEKNNPQIFLKIGDVCQRTGEKAEAIAAYLRAAQILRMQGFAQKALATYKIALRLDPDNQEIINRAEILIEEFETLKASPHISFGQATGMSEEKAEEQWTAPAQEEEKRIEEPSPQWLETTQVEPSGISQDEITSPEWLEPTSITAEKILPTTDETETVHQQADERSVGETAQTWTEPEQPSNDMEIESSGENADWLESAYEAVDTMMFKAGASQQQPSAEPEPDIAAFYEPTRLVPDDISKEVETFMTPLSERLTIDVPEIFEGLSEDTIRNFMSELSIHTYGDGEKIIEEGDSGDSMYIIKSGQVNVVAHLLGKKVELARLGEGDIFGEVGFLTGRPRTASVIASGKVQVYEISRLNIEKLLEMQPEILAKIEDFYEMRVRDTIKKIRS